MNINLITDASYDVRFPQTWRAESIAWALRRRLTQAEIDDIEAALIIFRYKRDVNAMKIAEAA